MAGSPSSSPTLVSASTELVARHLPARASLSTDLRIPTASERLREPKLTHAWGLPGKRIISSAGEGGIFKEERTEMLSPTGVSVEPDTSNPTWGAGGEPLTPCPGPASSPGSGWVWASQALCNRDAAEGRAEERTQGGRSCVGGGGQSSEFPGSGPFLQGRCRRSGLAPQSLHPISPYLVTPPGPRGLSCRGSEPFPKPPPGACTPGAGGALPAPPAHTALLPLAKSTPLRDLSQARTPAGRVKGSALWSAALPILHSLQRKGSGGSDVRTAGAEAKTGYEGQERQALTLKIIFTQRRFLRTLVALL